MVAESKDVAIAERAALVEPSVFDKADVDGSIAQRFAKLCSARAEAVAVTDHERSLTYRELDALSDRIAHGLVRSSGTEPSRVGLLFGLTAQCIAAHLAVWKAGKTCVPLDPMLPAARATAILKDAGADSLIAGAGLTAFAASLGAIDVLDCGAAAQSRPAGALTAGRQARTPAALIYVSGANGAATGITHTHRTLLHRCWSDTQYFQLTADDRIGLYASPGFDDLIPQMLGALLNGASVHLFDLQQRDFEETADWLRLQRISVFHPPVYEFRRFVETCRGRRRFADCRYVIQSGEATLMTTVDTWRRHFSRDCTFVSQLSDTRAQVVCRYSISRGQRIDTRYAPVGYADCDKQFTIVDANGEPAQRGTIGQLVVTSPFLSPGVWDSAAPPRSRVQEVQTLQTGDHVSLDDRGRLQYHGTSDGSFVARGHRVYLRDVETALLEFDAVRETVCAARELEDHRSQLVAFVVPADPLQPPADAQLRRWLRERLPEYMVPSRFLCVVTLPRAINGRISRCAVENLEVVQRSRGADLHTFENDLQRRFVEIWREAIGHEDIGIDDDILDIGGDTLSALRISTQIAQCIGRQVPVRTILELRSIRRLVQSIDRVDAPVTCVCLHPGVPRQNRRRPLFCIDGLYRYRPLAEALGPDWQTIGVRVTPETHLLKTCASQGRASGQPAGMWPPLVEQMAATYVEQIRGHQHTGPYQLIGAGFGGVIAFEIARQLAADAENVGLLGLVDTLAPHAFVPVTPAGWLRLAAQWVRNSLPVSLPDSRADRVTRARHRERSCEIALMRYRPGAFNGNAIVFTPAHQPQMPGMSLAPDLGWRSLISGQLTRYSIAGDGFDLLRPAGAAAIASTLRPFLDSRPWSSG